jgi:hypothetical protein
LQEAYSYSAGDALLLAEYITVYNAVYRGNWDFFSGRYKKPVLDLLNPRQNAGLSVRYDEWSGKTLMLIPLGIGGISSIDTSAISDDRVVDELRKADDLGIERRRDMVDLKEREADAAEQGAAEQRAQIRREEQAVTDERARTEREQQQLARDRQKLEDDKASGAVTSQDAAKRQEEIARRESEADKKSDELDRREQGLAAQREGAAGQEQFAEQKTEEAQRDRESIARDQQALIDRGDSVQGILALAIERRDETRGRIITLNPADGKELKRSPLDMVFVRTLVTVNGKTLAVAGENRGNAAVRLIEINPRTLEMAKQGDDDIHPNSLIWVNGSDLYVLTANLADGTLNLGRFNADLVLQAKSEIAVHPNASVSVRQGFLLTQKADGGAVLLNPADLKEKK